MALVNFNSNVVPSDLYEKSQALVRSTLLNHTYQVLDMVGHNSGGSPDSSNNGLTIYVDERLPYRLACGIRPDDTLPWREAAKILLIAAGWPANKARAVAADIERQRVEKIQSGTWSSYQKEMLDHADRMRHRGFDRQPPNQDRRGLGVLQLVHDDWGPPQWEAAEAARKAKAADKLKDGPMRAHSAIVMTAAYGGGKVKPVEVLVNPSERDVWQFGRETQFHELRSTQDQHGNLYVWKGDEALHGNMVRALADHGASFDMTSTQTAGHSWDLTKLIAPHLRDLLRSARQVARQARQVKDAASQRHLDPTRTKGLRRGFRASAQLNLNQLRATLRKAIVDYNFLGLQGDSNGMLLSPAARLRQFSDWFETAAFAQLDAKWWVQPWLNKAIASGLTRANREVAIDDRRPLEIYQDTFAALHQLAKQEIDGIVAAMIQKVTRTAHSAVTLRNTPTRAYRRMTKPIDSDIKNRLKAFTNTMTVKAHNTAKIETYRNNGIEKVGIHPERHRHDHAIVLDADDDGDVGVATAEDDLVCEECQDIADGSPYSFDEADGLIPAHANCRCSVFPWSENGDVEDSQTIDVFDPETGEGLIITPPPTSVVDDISVVDDFEEEKHPREPAGTPGGGQFASGGGSGRSSGGGRNAGQEQQQHQEVAGGGGRRGAVGSRGVEQAQAEATWRAAGYEPITGLPQKPIELKPNHWYVPGPIGRLKDAAAEYMKSAKLPYQPPTAYGKLDKERAAKIADEFDKMKHDPDDPHVKAAYNAMINETQAQWEALKKTGLKVEWVKPNQPDPYAASPRLAAMDVAENNHWWGFPTDLGFGSTTPEAQAWVHDNPLLHPTGEIVGGRHVVANDVFRIVHDMFGHFKEGNGFRAGGEENAWRSHSAMYSPLAREAMTSETRGQNSWVNYGPYGATNRTALAANTHFAPQKIGVLPDWAVNDGSGRPGTRDADWSETEHQREPAGSPTGGQFAPGGASHEGGGKSVDKKTKVKGDLKKLIASNSSERAVDRLSTALSEHNVEAADFERSIFAGLKLKNPPEIGSSPYSPGAIIVSGSFGIGGSINRSLNFENGSAKHEYLSLPDDQQGHGVAKNLLSSQIALYQKLGIGEVDLHANIDVGGYAWAKYGFVPNISSWTDLQNEMRDKIGSSESGGSVATGWDEMTEHEQDLAGREYIRNNLRSEIDYAEENWRDSDAWDDARSKLVEDFKSGDDTEWATNAIQDRLDLRAEDNKQIPYSVEQLTNALEVSHESGYSSDRGTKIDWDDNKLKEPKGFDPNQETLPGFEPIKPEEKLTPEMRTDLESALKKAFRNRAESIVSDLDPPDYLEESARESLSEVWDSMDDDDRFRYASRNTSVLEAREPSQEKTVTMPATDQESIENLINSDDPKAIWAISDSAYGKKLLLNSDWNGTLNLHDPQALARFNSYVNKRRQPTA